MRWSWAWLVRSLEGKLLVAVIVCALVPLAGVGMWLSSSAVRSGEQLLREQLDSAASRSAAGVEQRWALRQSDVLMLATSAPVRATLEASTGDTAPSYAHRAFSTMSGVSSVTLRDAANRPRWVLGLPNANSSSSSSADRRPELQGVEETPSTVLRAPVTDDAGHTLGAIVAQIRLDALTSTTATVELAPSQFVAYRDRRSGAQIGPVRVPAVAFTSDHFDWNGHHWLAVRQELRDPSIDVLAAAQLDHFLAPFTRTARAGAVALALAASIVLVLTMIVTARLTRSLGDLAIAADRVSRGALDARVQVPDSSEDEVGRVGRAFNTMLDSIAQMMRELSQREAVAAMGALAATIAHQVRSPATAMRLDVQRAHDKLPSDSAERALLARALGQLDRLERAVSASLKMARGSGAEFSEVDIREPLERAVAGVRREHEGCCVVVDAAQVDSKQFGVHGDAALLEQLFANVLVNAAQASSRQRVHVSVEPDGASQLAIRICDEGPGMTPDVLARAGEPLFSTKPEGTGLGLAIARRIASAHGGTLAIQCGMGKGTTVTIRLARGLSKV